MQKFSAGKDCHSAVNLEEADLFPRIQTAAASEAAAGVFLWGVLPSEDEKDSGSSTLVLHSRVQAHLGPPQDDLPIGSWLDRGDPLQGSTSELVTDRRTLLRSVRAALQLAAPLYGLGLMTLGLCSPNRSSLRVRSLVRFLHYGILTARTVPGT